MKPSPEFLQSLIPGQTLVVDMGAGGKHTGRVSRITDKLIFVRMGKEVRRFLREDGGTFQSPSFSKSWLAPKESDHA